MTSQRRHQNLLSLWVLALWATGIAIGLFGVLQVARVKDRFRVLAQEAFGLSLRFTLVEQHEEIILASAEAFAEAAVDGFLSEDERAHLSLLHQESLSALTQLKTVVSEIEKAVNAHTYLSADGLTVHQGLKSVLDQLKPQHERAARLIQQLERPSIDKQTVEYARSQAMEIEEVLHKVDREASKVLLLVASEAIEHTEQVERDVLTELLYASLIGMVLGALIIFRIRGMQTQLIEAEQLGVLGKLAISLQHEINNPLSVIVGNAYLLRSATLSEAERVSALQAVETSATSIASVLKRTKDMEKLVTTEYVGGLEMVDLSPQKRV